MTDFKDPDFSSVDALPDPDKGVKLSAELEQLSKGIRATAGSIDTNTGGRTPESVVNAAGEAAKGAQDLATNAAIAEQAVRMLKAAKAEWEKATIGARAADLTKAEMAVFLARHKYDEAWAAEDAAREAYNTAKTEADNAKTAAKVLETQKRLTDAKTKWDAAIETTKKANEELEARRKEFRDMKEKRKNADEAYERARTAACEKMAEIKGTAREGTDRGHGTPGDEAPVIPPTTTGPGVKVPAPKVGGHTTPGTTTAPGSTTPGTASPKSTDTGSGKTGNTPDAASLAAAQALMNQQGQQQPQQAQATPAATAPQQAQQPQNQQGQQKPEEKKDGKQALDASDISRLINGEDPAVVLGGGTPLGSAAPVNATGPSSPPQSAPSGQYGTSFRPAGTPIAGTTGGGTPAAPPPAPTTGHSVTGLNTQTDTSGRSTPAAGAYDPVKTNTSAAHGNSTAAQQAAVQQQGKGAMPMMPMTPMGAMPPSGGSGGSSRSGGDKDSQVLSTNGGLDHGQTAVSEAVRGGTIAQNRPDADPPRGGKAA